MKLLRSLRLAVAVGTHPPPLLKSVKRGFTYSLTASCSGHFLRIAQTKENTNSLTITSRNLHTVLPSPDLRKPEEKPQIITIPTNKKPKTKQQKKPNKQHQQKTTRNLEIRKFTKRI
jgi:hypothetical protein